MGTSWENQPPQLSFEAPPTQGWTPPPAFPPQEGQQPPWQQQGNGPVSQHLSWQQNSSLPGQPITQGTPQSLLPVPYQGPMSQTNMTATSALQLLPEHIIERMVPAQPEEQNTIYVAPMYTQPRALIPKYRIISGFLSVLIVTLLLCAGVGYYAKASGQLDAFQRLYNGGTLPPNLKAPPKPQIPDPPDRVDKGPAYSIIPSATTASRIDAQNLVALQPEKIFKPGDTIYVTYSVKTPNKAGSVNIKWYMNKLYYGPANSHLIDPKTMQTLNGKAQIVYSEPAEGSVELYWNDQLAQRLYFAVR